MNTAIHVSDFVWAVPVALVIVAAGVVAHRLEQHEQQAADAARDDESDGGAR